MLKFSIYSAFVIFLAFEVHASESISLNVSSFFELFKKQYQSSSPERLKHEIEDWQLLQSSPWFLNPTLSASMDNNSQVSLSQNFFTGTSVSWQRTFSKSYLRSFQDPIPKEMGESMGISLSQKLLQGAPFWGFTDITIHKLNKEKLEFETQADYQKALKDAFLAFLELKKQLRNQAILERSNLRTRKNQSNIKELVKQGHKARADLIEVRISELNIERKILSINQSTKNKSRLLAELLYLPLDSDFKVNLEESEEKLMEKISEIQWSEKTVNEKIAEINQQLALQNAKSQKLKILPNLSVSVSLNKGLEKTDDTNWQQRVALNIEVPLGKTVTRSEYKIGEYQRQKALLEANVQNISNIKTRKELDEKIQQLVYEKESQNERINLAKKNLEVTQQRYAEGNISIRELMLEEDRFDGEYLQQIEINYELLNAYLLKTQMSGKIEQLCLTMSKN